MCEKSRIIEDLEAMMAQKDKQFTTHMVALSADITELVKRMEHQYYRLVRRTQAKIFTH